jgi:flagellar biosynthesis chaperone FliJ
VTAFRLARLLALREDQEKADKIRWALAEREARGAAEHREAGRQHIRDARAELARSHEFVGDQPSQATQSTLSAYQILDGLNERAIADDEALEAARALAAEARQPYDVRRREVEALKRLEHRWATERRRQRRRKENRESEAYINGRFAMNTHSPTRSTDTAS